MPPDPHVHAPQIEATNLGAHGWIWTLGRRGVARGFVCVFHVSCVVRNGLRPTWLSQESHALKSCIEITHFYHYHDDQNNIIGRTAEAQHSSFIASGEVESGCKKIEFLFMYGIDSLVLLQPGTHLQASHKAHQCWNCCNASGNKHMLTHHQCRQRIYCTRQHQQVAMPDAAHPGLDGFIHRQYGSHHWICIWQLW